MHNGIARPFRTMPKLDAATCAGYASNIPEVLEVVHAFPQWKERTLTEWLGAEPTPPLLACLAALQSGKNQLEYDQAEKMREEAERKRRDHGQ